MSCKDRIAAAVDLGRHLYFPFAGKAMDMILTSSTVSGKELEQLGLVARSFPLDKLLVETMASAHKITLRSAPVL
jgi:enoyl-CoA hydratase/carnithine racemase